MTREVITTAFTELCCDGCVFKRSEWQPGLSGKRESSGLKGSLSTYTLTENQSIAWLGREGGDEELDRRKRIRAEGEGASRLFKGSAERIKILWHYL